MKTLWRILIFVLAFQVEVRVRADEVISSPKDCLNSNKGCAFNVNKSGRVVTSRTQEISAKKDTVLIRTSSDSWRLIQGFVWVEKSAGIKLRSLFATIDSEGGSFAYNATDEDRHVIRNLTSKKLIITVSDGRELELPLGFEVWISGIKPDGKSDFGVPQPIEMVTHLLDLKELFKGGVKQALAHKTFLLKQWGNVEDRSGYLYEQVANRHIAQAEEESRLAEQKEKRKIEEKKALRKKFIQKTLQQ